MTLPNPSSTGIVILTLIAVVYGGTHVLHASTGPGYTQLQRTYKRAGHGHAGMLVTLGLVVQLLMSDPRVPSWAPDLASGVLWAAVLMPAGFFLSVAHPHADKPNAFRYLIWLGAASLVTGLAAAGIALIMTGTR